MRDLVAGESRAGLARAGADREVGDGFGFEHFPRQHTYENIVHRLPTRVLILLFYLRLFRAGLEERICGDVSSVAVSRGEVNPSVDQTFASVILKRVVQYVSLRRALPKIDTLVKTGVRDIS